MFFIAAFLMLGYLSYSQIKIFPEGKVSIGNTSSPSEKGLTHFITGSKIGFAGLSSTITSSALIRGNNVYSSATTPDYTWYNNDQTGLFHPAAGSLGISTNGTQRMLIDANGNFAFNSSPVSGVKFYAFCGLSRFAYIYPGYNTAVNIELYAVDPRIYSPSNKIVFYNTPGGNFIDISVRNVFLNSDLKSKTDVTQLNDCLEKVMKLNGVSYYWKTDSAKRNLNTGLIAQEVEKIIPEAVITDDSLHNKLISYNAIIPYLIESIKEQQNEIEKQKSKIREMENNIDLCCFSFTGSTKSRSDENTDTKGEKPLLGQNIPNPFNNTTEIKYKIPSETENSSIIVFDMTGKLVITYPVNGSGSLTISSNELNPGMYYYSLVVNGTEYDTKRMIISK